MFKKLEKVGKRRGTKPVKVLYRLEVNNVNIKNATNLEGKVYVSCCFERGNKMVATNDELCRVQANGDAEVYFDQTLSIVATMYQDSDGNFLDKTGKFIFRLKTKSGTYKGLGVYDLPLHYYATRYQPLDEILTLNKAAATSITAHVTITPKILDQTSDDVSSNLSGCTDHTSGAADFTCNLSDAGSEIGDGEDDDMMDRSLSRARTVSVGSDTGSIEGEPLSKSKSAPILISTKRQSPLPSSSVASSLSSSSSSSLPTTPPITTSQSAVSYSNLNTLTPILSSDSIDENSSPDDVQECKGLNEKSEKEEIELHGNHPEHNLNIDSHDIDEANEHTTLAGKEKLLVSQDSSDTFINTHSKPRSSSSYSCLFCCYSPASTTQAVIQEVQPPLHTPTRSSSSKKASSSSSSRAPTTTTATQGQMNGSNHGTKTKKSNDSHNTTRGKSREESCSLDHSTGKSPSLATSHSSSTSSSLPSSGRKLSTEKKTVPKVSNPSGGGGGGGGGNKKSSVGESKPDWLN